MDEDLEYTAYTAYTMLHFLCPRHAAAAAAAVAAAALGVGSVSAATGPVTFPSPSGVSTSYSLTSYNPLATSTYLAQTDFSNERLALLWDQVGPVATGPITTTVTPTPEPSAYPSPGAFHPLVPAYEPALNNVTLPRDFVWGVASSSYQIEVGTAGVLTYLGGHPC